MTMTLQPGEIAYAVNGGATRILGVGGAISDGSGSWSMKISGVPAVGDQINISPATINTSNNGNALNFLNLRDAKMVGGETVTDAYSSTLADIGVRVKTAQSVSAMSQSIADDAKTSNDSVSGVNLDEEAAKLIQYQQSYQAAGKILQVAQTIFQTLLQLGG